MGSLGSYRVHEMECQPTTPTDSYAEVKSLRSERDEGVREPGGRKAAKSGSGHLSLDSDSLCAIFVAQ